MWYNQLFNQHADKTKQNVQCLLSIMLQCLKRSSHRSHLQTKQVSVVHQHDEFA